MATTIAPTKGTGFGAGDGSDGRRFGGDGGGSRRPLPPGTHLLGMGLGLTSISMLFIALTSAYIVRHGLSSDWENVRMPPVVLVNTMVLLASSITLEKTRRALQPGGGTAQGWLIGTLLLGVAFLTGQLVAWRQLAAEGIYLGTNPHSSFFYMLTATHGVHVLGGIAGLSCLVWRGGRWLGRPSWPRQRRWFETTALYWHFMDGLWIYLVVLLFGLT